MFLSYQWYLKTAATSNFNYLYSFPINNRLFLFQFLLGPYIRKVHFLSHFSLVLICGRKWITYRNLSYFIILSTSDFQDAHVISCGHIGANLFCKHPDPAEPSSTFGNFWAEKSLFEKVILGAWGRKMNN